MELSLRYLRARKPLHARNKRDALCKNHSFHRTDDLLYGHSHVASGALDGAHRSLDVRGV